MNTPFVPFLSQPFPFYLEDNRKNFILNVSISLFTCFFLIIFEPWENEVERGFVDYFVYGFVCFIVLTININILPRFFPKLIDLEDWTFGKFVLYNAFNMFIIGCFIWPYNIYTCIDSISLEGFLGVQYKTFTTGIIITVILFFFLQYKGLRKQLSDQQPGSGFAGNDENKKVALNIQSDTSENISVPFEDFLFAKAQDNYTEVFWVEEGKPTSKLLRMTLRKLENQIDQKRILRTHRSFLVNFDQIHSYSGNSNGLKLSLNDYNGSIPVSRGFIKFIENHLPA